MKAIIQHTELDKSGNAGIGGGRYYKRSKKYEGTEPGEESNNESSKGV